MKGSSCEDVQAFLDGELDEGRAHAFRLHLPECEACRARLERAFHLGAMAATAYAATGPAVPAPHFAGRPRWLVRPMALAAVLVAPLAAALMLVVIKPRPPPEAWAVAGPKRALEPRVTYEPADRYLPFDAMRGPSEAERAVSLQLAAALEAQGDEKGVATLFLLTHVLKQADPRLQALPPSPQRDADLAALALVGGKPELALERASAALEADPHLSQAMWNRALALSGLGFFREASAAFREVAALQERGWSGEAAGRAELEARRQQDRRPGALEGTDPRLQGPRQLREQAGSELAAGRRAASDRLLLEAYRQCRALGEDAHCAD